MGSVRHLQTLLELTYTKRDTMAKFLGLFSLCLLLVVAEAKSFKKAKYAKKDEKLKCSTVIDEVSHEVCRTEYHDECKDKHVDDCKDVWKKICHPATEKKCTHKVGKKCIDIPHPFCEVKFVEKWETKCHTGPSKCETVWENKCHASTEKVCKDVEEHDSKLSRRPCALRPRRPSTKSGR